MKKPKVLIITYYWPPSGGSGVQRWMYFTKYLSEFGVTPTVITVDEKFASYPSKDITFNNLIKDIGVHKTKTLEPLRFYSFLKSGKTEKVVPQGNVGGKKKGILDKVATYVRANFFMPDARVGWNKYAYSKAKELLQKEHFDLVITTGPPHSTHLVGQKIKKELGIKWMADFRDPWTEVYYNNLFKRTPKNEAKDKQMELSVLQDADIVLTVGPSMMKLLADKVPTQPDKFHFIYNGFDDEKFKLLHKVKNDIFTIRYVGTLTENYPYKETIEALNLLTIDKNELNIELIGNIEPSVFDYFKNHCIFSVTNIPSVSHNEAIQYMKNADLLLLLLPFMENAQIMLTGKLFEYLATKNPILCVGDKKADAATIVEQLGNSKAFEKNELSEIQDFIYSNLKNKANPSDNSLNTNKFSRYETARTLSELIKNMN
jgi:glycosyltransferase involved in cell wall biosynthesis